MLAVIAIPLLEAGRHIYFARSLSELSLTWSDAVHHSNEGISIPPAGTEVVDLYSQLLGDLRLHPLEQRFLGAHLPLLLGLPVDAPLPQGAVIVSAACVSSPTTRTGETLAELLQNPSVLLDLEIGVPTEGYREVFIKIFLMQSYSPPVNHCSEALNRKTSNILRLKSQ